MKTLPLFFVAVLLICLGVPVSGAAESPTYDSIRVTRVMPERVTAGDTITITLDVINTGSGSRTVDLTEFLSGEAEFDTGSARATRSIHDTEEFLCSGPTCGHNRTPYPWTITSYSHHWVFTLAPGGKKQVSYRLLPKTAGEVWIPSATLKVDGKEHLLPAGIVSVACTTGHACDASRGENAITCPENCAKGAADGLCTLAKDGACDPDCRAGSDPDCRTYPSKQSMPLMPIILGIIAVILIAAGAGWYFLKKKKT